jgi:hypothetical protein
MLSRHSLIIKCVFNNLAVDGHIAGAPTNATSVRMLPQMHAVEREDARRQPVEQSTIPEIRDTVQIKELQHRFREPQPANDSAQQGSPAVPSLEPVNDPLTTPAIGHERDEHPQPPTDIRACVVGNDHRGLSAVPSPEPCSEQPTTQATNCEDTHESPQPANDSHAYYSVCATAKSLVHKLLLTRTYRRWRDSLNHTLATERRGQIIRIARVLLTPAFSEAGCSFICCSSSSQLQYAFIY